MSLPEIEGYDIIPMPVCTSPAYIFHWRGRDPETLRGRDPERALSRAGYSRAQIRAELERYELAGP